MIYHNRLSHIIFFVAVFLFFGCSAQPSKQTLPIAQKGNIDLRNWNFKTDGIIELRGEWYFFWNTLLDPKKFNPQKNGIQSKFDSLPTKWNPYKIDGKKIGAFGYATYALTLSHHNAQKPLAFVLKEMSSAYRFYIDGELVASNGTVGTSKPIEVPEYKPVLVEYTPLSNKTNIVLHISNFNHREGGPSKSIKVGDVTHLKKQNTTKQVINLLLIGSILMMGLYNVSLYVLRTQWIAPFHFGLFCIIVTLRSALTNQRFFHILWPNVSWELLLKLEYLSFYLAVPAFTLYIASLFPKEIPKIFKIFIFVFSIIFSAIVIVTPPVFFTHTLNMYQAFTVLSGLYLIRILFKAYQLKRDGIVVIATGFLILFTTVIYDILGANDMVQGDYSVHLGLFIFLFSQSYVLAGIFVKTMHRVEKQKMEIVNSHQQFKNSRIALILGLAKLAEYRDEDTGAHLERIREYAKSIAIALSEQPKYKQYITEDYINDIYQSSILHDIGKVGIQDAILLKPGKLTPEEFEIIKSHPVIGGDALSSIESSSQVRSFLTLGRDIAYYHHERWDGSGYPTGLKGNEIPLSARIVAVADVYDALTSERPYKKAFSHENAVKIILKDSGTHFDPDIIEAFKKLTDQFKQIRQNLID